MNNRKCITTTYLLRGLKERSYMITPIGAREKTIGEIQPLWGNFLNLIKGIGTTSRANIMLNDENRFVFTLGGTKAGMLSASFFIAHCTSGHNQCLVKTWTIKCVRNGKKSKNVNEGMGGRSMRTCQLSGLRKELSESRGSTYKNQPQERGLLYTRWKEAPPTLARELEGTREQMQPIMKSHIEGSGYAWWRWGLGWRAVRGTVPFTCRVWFHF